MLTLRSRCPLLFLLASFLPDLVRPSENLLGIDGSGTTNPSKCYWNIIDKLQTQARLPIRISYRAVGSSTGQLELSNNFTNSGLVVDFASGDIPISSDDYNKLASAGIGVLHLPILLGAVSVFHSLPDSPDLNLTACILAKIYTLQITEWSDPEIKERNPNLTPKAEGLKIRAGVRSLGSSSTGSFTEYLRKACPEFFPQELTSSLPEWSEEHPRCLGSGGMTECIVTVPGTIGYIDSGHGHAAGLEEIELQNLQGTFLTSRVAAERNGILAERSAFPENTYDDFGKVALTNGPGTNTWPILQMTYLYVRRNLTFIEDPQDQALLIAFLRSLQNVDYIGECAELYGFTLPSAEVMAYTKSGIDLLESELRDGAPTWIFENETLPIEGAGLYVISKLRDSIASIERSELAEDIVTLQEMVTVLESNLSTAFHEIEEHETGSSLQGSSIYMDNDTQLMAALVLSSLSFGFWIIYFILAIYRKCTKPKAHFSSPDDDATGNGQVERTAI